MKRIAKNTICLKPGEYIAPGEEINPTKEQEKDLDAAGALQDKDAKARSAPAGPAKPSGAALTDAIVSAAGSLDTNAEDAWTAAGKPSVLALEKVLGYPVAPAERDGAWDGGDPDPKA